MLTWARRCRRRRSPSAEASTRPGPRFQRSSPFRWIPHTQPSSQDVIKRHKWPMLLPPKRLATCSATTWRRVGEVPSTRLGRCPPSSQPPARLRGQRATRPWAPPPRAAATPAPRSTPASWTWATALRSASTLHASPAARSSAFCWHQALPHRRTSRAAPLRFAFVPTDSQLFIEIRPRVPLVWTLRSWWRTVPSREASRRPSGSDCTAPWLERYPQRHRFSIVLCLDLFSSYSRTPSIHLSSCAACLAFVRWPSSSCRRAMFGATSAPTKATPAQLTPTAGHIWRIWRLFKKSCLCLCNFGVRTSM